MPRCKMFCPEMRQSPLPPGAHEIVVEGAPDGGARNRNQPSCPLLNNFCTCLRRNPLDHFRHEAIDHSFSQQLTADVHTGGAGSGDPEFGDVVADVPLEYIK